MPGKPYKTNYAEETITVAVGFGLNSERKGFNPASGFAASSYRRPVPQAGDSHR